MVQTDNIVQPDHSDIQVVQTDDIAYEAFISYQHNDRDIAVAQEIQHFIEGFSVPRALRGNGVGARLGKVFRDEDELPASAHLSDQIQTALRRSRFLIVVCSPEAANSAWVEREIEFFSEIHGHDHVIAALAAGTPEESFPRSLRALGDDQSPQSKDLSEQNNDNDSEYTGARSTDVTYGDAGDNADLDDRKTWLEEPLAADLRPEKTHKQRRTELLRIASALIGCSLDDVVQRVRTRRRRNIIVILCAIVLVAVVVGVVIAQSLTGLAQSNRENQINESEQRATDSATLLAQGDRIGALQAALSALPSSSDDQSSPLLPSARAALVDALGVYPHEGGWWQPCYTLDGKQDLNNLAVPQTGDWFALCEQSERVEIYDLISGGVRYSLAPPAVATGGFDGFMEAAGNYLACSVEDNVLACFDASTGELLWATENFYPVYFEFSEDATCFGALGVNESGGRTFCVFDSQTGEILHNYVLSDLVTDLTFSGNQFAVFNDGITRALIGVDSNMFVIDLQTDEIRQTTTNDERITSACILDNSVIVIGCNMPSGDSINVGSTHDAIDVSVYPTSVHVSSLNWDSLELLWERDISWEAYQSEGSSFTTTDAFMWKGFNAAEGHPSAFVLTAGSSVDVINADDGSTINEFDLGSPVVTCRCVEDASGDAANAILFAVTFEGNYFVMSAFGENAQAYTYETFTFPEQTWLVCSANAANSLYFVGASGENLDKLFVYRCDFEPAYYEGLSLGDGFYGGVSINCDNTLISWLRNDRTLVVFDVASDTILLEINLDDIGVNPDTYDNVSLAFSADEPSIAYLRDSGAGTNEPHIWRIDVQSGAVDAVWSWEYAASDALAGVTLTFDSCTISAEHAGTFTVLIPDYSYIGLIDAATFNAIAEFMPNDDVPLADVLAINDRTALMRFSNDIVALYDLTTFDKIGEVMDDYRIPSGLSLDVAAAVSHDEKQVVLACADGYLRSFDCKRGDLLWEAAFTCGDLGCYLAYMPDDSALFTQDSSGTCMVFDVSTGEMSFSTDDVEATVADVTFAQVEGQKKAFVFAVDTTRGSKSLYVLDLDDSSDASGDTSSAYSTTDALECVIPDGLLTLLPTTTTSDTTGAAVTDQGASGTDHEASILIVYSAKVYLVPYYSFDELLDLAQTVVTLNETGG